MAHGHGRAGRRHARLGTFIGAHQTSGCLTVVIAALLLGGATAAAGVASIAR